MTTRRAWACVAAVAAGGALAACASHSPTQPNPPTPCTNTAPVILSITAQGIRSKEPADFADVGESIPIAAIVQDAETPVDRLQLQWSATAGTIVGSGPNVTWQAPGSGTLSTPIDVMVTLTVVESYTCGGQTATLQNTVSATHTISLHDSLKEVGDMATQFLLDFSDSSITDVSYVMRNFEPTCYGTASETLDVTDNRKKFTIQRFSVGPATVTEPFGDTDCRVPGLLPGDTQHGAACVNNKVHWESTIIQSGPYQGDQQIADGIDWISASYYAALKAWKLCDSRFTGTCTDTTNGMPCGAENFRAMVAGRIK